MYLCKHKINLRRMIMAKTIKLDLVRAGFTGVKGTGTVEVNGNISDPVEVSCTAMDISGEPIDTPCGPGVCDYLPCKGPDSYCIIDFTCPVTGVNTTPLQT
jgi:hypothetical protein